MSDIAAVDVVSGGFKIISKHITPSRVLLSPDRKTLVYSVPKTRNRNSFYVASDVHTLELATSKDRAVFIGVKNYGGSIQFSFAPSGRFLAFPDVVRTDIAKNEQFTDFVLVDFSGGPPIRIKAEFPDHIANDTIKRAVWSKDGKWISFFRANSLETWDALTVKQVSRISISSNRQWDS